MGEIALFQVPAPNTYRRARLGRTVQHPGQVRGMPVPTTYHLLFIHTGEVFVTRGALAAAGHAPSRVPAGSAVLLRPQDLYHERTTGPVPSLQSWLAVVPDALSQEQLGLLDASPDLQPLSLALDRVQEAIIGAALYFDAAADEAVEGVLTPLITGALMLYVHEARLAGRLSTPDHQHPAVAAARDAIRRRLNEPLSLRDLAAAGHVTPEHLVRLFRRELDTTPARYLWAERIRAGIHLLERSALPIAEVAHQAGFQTPSHFSRAVLLATGLRPGQLRRRSHTAAATEDSVLPSS
jgi:AraC family transcriptional regulator, arabinose operon regulatory protein